MTGQPPAPIASGNKLGALCIAAVCVIVAVGIYVYFSPPGGDTATCIKNSGGSTRCGLPSGAAGAIGAILFFGFAAAGRTWKGR